MPFIPIPEGMNEVRMFDGNWISIPKGMTEVDTDMLWKGSDKISAEDQVDMFGEMHRWSEPSKVVSGAGERIADVAQQFTEKPVETAQEVGRDVVGGGTYGIGDIVDFVGETYSGGLPQAGLRLYNWATGGEESKGALEDTLSPVGESLKQQGIDIAHDPKSATFAVTALGGAGEASAIKSAELAAKGASKVATKGKEKIASMIPKKESESDFLIRRGETKPEEEGIDKGDLLELAEVGQTGSEDILINAIKEGGAETAQKYINLQTARTKAVEETAGKGNFAAVKKANEDTFNDMIKAVQDVEIDDLGFDTSIITKKLDEVKGEFTVTDATDTKIEKLISQIETRGVQTVGGIIEARKFVNAQLAKTSGGESKKWKEVKDSLDEYLNSNLEKPVLDLVDTATENWKRMSQQEELLKIIEDNTKTLGSGNKEKKISNWKQIDLDLQSSKLDSPEVKETARIIRKLNDKYGDVMYERLGIPMSRGDSPYAAIAGDPRDSMRRILNNSLINKILTALSSSKRASSAVRKAIDASDTKKQFLQNLSQSKNIPDNIRSEMQRLMDEFRDLDLKRQELPKNVTIDKKIRDQALRLKEQEGASSIAIQKQELKLNTLDENINKAIDDLENAISGDKDTKSIEKRILKLKEQKLIAMQELEKKQQTHARIRQTIKEKPYNIEDFKTIENLPSVDNLGVTKKGVFSMDGNTNTGTFSIDSKNTSKTFDAIDSRVADAKKNGSMTEFERTEIKLDEIKDSLPKDIQNSEETAVALIELDKKTSSKILNGKGTPSDFNKLRKKIKELQDEAPDAFNNKPIDSGSEEYGDEMSKLDGLFSGDKRIKTMTVDGTEIRKTDFDAIKSYQKKRKFNRDNPTKKRKITSSEQKAYDRYADIADSLEDVDFKQDK